MNAAKLEVHEHWITRGPRSHRTGNWPAGQGSAFFHSHEGGNVPHEHPDAGPASFTIDKDEWARKTGLKGGGRKKFTARPSGEQFPLVASEPVTFEVFVTDSALVQGEDGNLRPITPEDDISGGGNISESLRQKFGMRANVVDLRTRRAAHR